MNIIDIPDEYEQEVVELIEDEIINTLTESLVIIISNLNENEVIEVIRQFPALVAAIDNPSERIKAILGIGEYKYANNLTEDEIQEIIDSDEIWQAETLIGKNRKILEKVITVERIIEFMNDHGHDCLDSYKETNKHKEAKRLYNLETM